jgi:hypothetical protein
MLEVEKTKDDRIALGSIGLGSVYVEGTILAVKDAGKPYVSYQVNWDDNQYAGEWYTADELEEVSPTTVQTHLA